LDPTFTTNGKVALAFGSDDSRAYSAALQSDNKIVLAGESGGDFAIARIDTDGTPDTSFSGDGKQTQDFNSETDRIHSVQLTGSGRILVGGFATQDSVARYAMARYLSNGTLETGFGTKGTLTARICDSAADKGYAIAVQSNSRIVMSGTTDPGITPLCKYVTSVDTGLARFSASGSTDRTWDIDGVSNIDHGSGVDENRAIAIQSDGKIVVAGYSHNGSNFDISLARINP